MSVSIRYSLLFLLLGLVVSCAQVAPNAPEPTSRVDGLITNDDGQSIPDAVVQVLDKTGAVVVSGTTDINGYFRMEALDASGKSLRVQHHITDNTPRSYLNYSIRLVH